MHIKIKAIEKTKLGDVLVERDAAAENRTKFRTALPTAIREMVKFRQLTPTAQIGIRDLDTSTELQEVKDDPIAFLRIEKGSEIKITASINNYRNNLVDFVDLDAVEAAMVEGVAHYKIG